MPRKKIYKPKMYKKNIKKYRKRFKKKVFRKISKSTIVKTNAFDKQTFVKMPYNTWGTISAASGSIGYRVYRLNSIWACDYTMSNGQPYSYDQ